MRAGSTSSSATGRTASELRQGIVGVRPPHRIGAEAWWRLQGDWPSWWEWDLLISDHALERMLDRGFNETDVRTMLTVADRVRWGSSPDRWIASTKHHGHAWEVVIERDEEARRLILVTAYRLD